MAAKSVEKSGAFHSDGALKLDAIQGQPRAVRALVRAAGASKISGEAALHALLFGPPGLGKSSLAQAYAEEIGTRAHFASAPLLKDPGALLGVLLRLSARDVLFIDEIHALPVKTAEALYEALENRRLSLVVTDGTRERTLQIRLEPFTLVGATTEMDLVPAPLQMRFPICVDLDFYAPEVLAGIVADAAVRKNLPIDQDAAHLLARAGRDTPRVALALLAQVRDAALISGQSRIDRSLAARVLEESGVAEDGQTALDRRLMELLTKNGRGRPLGLHRLAACLGAPARTIRNVLEPFLLRRGLLVVTPQGRMAVA